MVDSASGVAGTPVAAVDRSVVEIRGAVVVASVSGEVVVVSSVVDELRVSVVVCSTIVAKIVVGVMLDINDEVVETLQVERAHSKLL